MFITKKKISGKEYYYLQKSVREKDKVKSEYVAYLGKDKTDAEKKAEEIKKQLVKNKNQFQETNKKSITIDELAAFCKRKGFVYPSGEIYGGLAGLYDYGHNGLLLKKNFENMWRTYFLGLHENFLR